MTGMNRQTRGLRSWAQRIGPAAGLSRCSPRLRCARRSPQRRSPPRRSSCKRSTCRRCPASSSSCDCGWTARRPSRSASPSTSRRASRWTCRTRAWRLESRRIDVKSGGRRHDPRRRSRRPHAPGAQPRPVGALRDARRRQQHHRDARWRAHGGGVDRAGCDEPQRVRRRAQYRGRDRAARHPQHRFPPRRRRRRRV